MSGIDEQFLYQFRVIIIGDQGVGKSCMLLRYKENRFEPMSTSTVGVDLHIKTVLVDGHKLKLQLWDTAGQERFRAIARAYFRNAVAALLVFNIANKRSFDRLPDWIRDIKEHATQEHTPIFLIVGNCSDRDRYRQVSRLCAEEFARREGVDYIETSAMTGSNIEEAFNLLAKRTLEAIQDGRIQVEDDWEGVKKGEESLELRKVHLTRRISKIRDVELTPRNRKGGCC